MSAKNKKTLFIGMFLAISFLGVLLLIFSPIFGDGKNGLQFSDNMFNRLSKGSSYFIPNVLQSNEKFIGRKFTVTLKLERHEDVQKAVKVLTKTGAQVETIDTGLKVSGDLGGILSNALKDSDAMYKNEGKGISDLYGFDEKEVMVAWWNILKQLDKIFKKEGKIEESKIVSEVMKKAVEPSHNFYGIDAQRVTDRAGLMTGLLVFYVVYTMWWGFAIFYLFEGFGLTMKKAKIKKEV
jgi:hypothetical protein